MKKILKHCASCTAFLLILILMIYALSPIVQPKTNLKEDGMTYASAYGILGEPENTIDVIFIGDSESYCSFNPQQIWKEYGITSYVCGTPAQILPYTNELIAQVFEKQSPKTVVLETNVIFRKSTKESAIFNKIEQQFPVFRYHDRWKSLSIDDWKLEYDYSYTNKQKGFRSKKDIVPADATEYMVYTAEKKKIPTNNTNYVDKMKTLCENNGAELILVSTPSTKNWSYKKHNAVEEYAKKANLTYIDLNLLQDEVAIDWQKDTRDAGDHLNTYGAEKVSGYMGEYFNKTGKFQDKRNDATYIEWNKLNKKKK